VQSDRRLTIIPRPTTPQVDPHAIVDVAVIGGGPVGLYAAFYAGMRQMTVKILDSLEELGGQLTALYPEKYIYDVAGFPKIFAKDLVSGLVEQGLQFGALPCLGEQVKTLQHVAADGATPEHYVLTTSKATHRARLICICAGVGSFTPRALPIENPDAWVGKGLSYFVKRVEDFRDKRVLLVGGGDSAVDWANMLAPITANQVLIHRRDKFRAHEDSVEKMMKTRTKVMLWHELKRIEGNGKIERAVVYDNRSNEETVIECDAVVSNLGFVNTLGPIKDWGLTIEKNSIVVDRLQRTNRVGIFSAGDICTYEGKLKLIASGFGEAATAVNFGKTLIDPSAKLFPGHSSERT
jgi:ferredoxin/flavodoxin---NADP+ reductase